MTGNVKHRKVVDEGKIQKRVPQGKSISALAEVKTSTNDIWHTQKKINTRKKESKPEARVERIPIREIEQSEEGTQRN